MKKIISVIFAIAVAFFGMHNNTPSTNAGDVNKIVKSFCDEEPITMTAHVRTSGGLPVSGATVSLKLPGTPNPQYSGTTNSNGDYAFTGVVKETYQYKIVASGYVTKSVGVLLNADVSRTDTLIAQ